MDLLARIDSWARQTPEQTVHVSGSRRLTYGELRERSNMLAGSLATILGGDKSPVVIYGHKEAELLIAFLGVVKAGHPYVPVDTVTPAQRLEKIVAASSSRLTLTPERVNELAVASASCAPQPVGLADAYYIMFTSGSTGEPKGVVLTLGNLTSFLEWELSEHPFEERSEVFMNVVPYSFDVSMMDTYPALLTGGTVQAITKEDVATPKRLYQTLTNSGITTWVSTPSFAQMCLVEKSFDASMLPGLRRFLFCGETLAPEIASKLLDRFPAAEVWNTYGPTEATVATTSVKITRDVLARYSPLPIGYPMPGTWLPVVDANLREVPAGERGQIVICGPNVSPGYLKRDDLTAKAFYETGGQRAYQTGDWGRYRDGMLFFEGRMDSQIKLYGYRIELADVEANLRAVANVRDAVVLPVPKEGLPESLAAFVILNDRPAGVSDFQMSNALRIGLGERLPAYMIPRKFRFLDTFPMNANGKADRRKLADMLG